MIKDFLKSIYWEILSYFVPERQSYEVTGKCIKCGKCCKNIYSAYMYSEQEFEFMKKIFPSYRRFYIKRRDEKGNFIFGCQYLKNNLCSVYEKRPRLCRSYPQKRLAIYSKMPDGCGYKVEKKSFNEYLQNIK
ncbi:YkgJ family cysteine cluster protein [bacterium]|nr:YkgJ family cysteine cluster protein [bacterium]